LTLGLAEKTICGQAPIGIEGEFMSEIKVLIPYNFSVHDRMAFDFIIKMLAGREDVHISIFNSYPPTPKIDFEANPELKGMKDGFLRISEELQRKEEGLNTARDYLINNGFKGDQINIIFKEKQLKIDDEIVSVIKDGEFNIVVLTPTPGKVKKLFARSVREKVLSSVKNVTVCIPLDCLPHT
jgi:hypothetical protein